MKDELARAVYDYLLGMERFCKRNFGTTDLRKCRIDLSRAYENVWGK